MNCPQCGSVMRERDRSGVRIDFCPDCKGVWLDRGELDKIIQIELDDGDSQAVEARSLEASRARRRDDDDEDDDADDRGLRPARRRGDYEEPRKSKKSTFFESLTDMFGGE
ncbi:MAG: zf-TFIIB domain-containing protein [Dehalococcoidia bacterium]